MKILISILLFFSVSCKTNNPRLSEKTIQIAKVTAQKWVGGRPETGFGYNIVLLLEKPLSKEVELQSITYKNATAPLVPQSDVLFKAKTQQKNADYILDEATYNEQNNTIPIPKNITLKPNEAFLVYTQNHKKEFLILANINELEPLLMP